MKRGFIISSLLVLFAAASNCAFFGGLGVPELLIIFLIILILFGANKIPKIARDLGGGIREFKKNLSENPEDKNDKDKTVQS